MIRDPSDGTVKEKPAPMVSGLSTEKKSTDETERLNKSREWLKAYFGRGQ